MKPRNDFTNWLKYGTRTFSKEMLIELFDANLKSETLLEKVGLFEEDFEIFFCVLNETFLYQTDTIFPVSVYQITEIKPLSEKVVPILKQKWVGGKMTWRTQTYPCQLRVSRPVVDPASLHENGYTALGPGCVNS